MELKLGTVIKRLRTEKGLTQEDLAQKIGVSFQAISKWETNTTTPDISLLPELALFFGVSIDELFSLNANDYMERIDNILRDEHTINSENFVWAERYLKGILSESPQNNEARRRLMWLYEHRKNRDSLAQGRYAEEGILLEPMDVDFNSRLVTIREERKELDRLIAFYEPFVKKFPKNHIIVENLVSAYIKCRYFDKARHLISTSYSQPAYDVLLGDIELALGNEKAAKDIWTKTATKYPNDEITLFKVAERLEKVRDYEAAIILYWKKYEISPAPKKLDSIYALAFLYEKLGRIQDAVRAWETIIKGREEDYHINSGETIDWPKRELEKLKLKLTVDENKANQ